MENKPITLTNEDLEIIQTFTDMYREIENKFEEYKEICESLEKNILFQTLSEQEKEKTPEERYEILKQKINKQIEETKDEYSQNRLKNQLESIEEDINKIKKYTSINKLYYEMYLDNLSKYFPEKQEEDINEKPMKIYKGKEEPEEIEEKEYYFSSKTTITQIYIRIGYLRFFNENDMKMDQELLEFYQKFKEPIKEYIKDNYERIMTEIKKINQQIHPPIEMTSSQKIM